MTDDLPTWNDMRGLLADDTTRLDRLRAVAERLQAGDDPDAKHLLWAADRIEADALLLESLLYAQDRVAAALTAERDALQKVIDDFEEALAGATVSLHITDPEDAERLDAAHLALFGEATTDDD